MDELIKIDVRMNKEQIITDSRNISATFGKRHDHILRDIDSLKKDVPNFGEMFYESEMPDSYGRMQKVYLMNRDGFTLLAMGFTGKEAMEWKLKYINAFNAMEAELNTPEQIMARALKVADLTISNLKIENKQLVGKIKEQKPLVDFANHVSESVDEIDMETMAKLASDEGIDIGRNRLIRWMKEKKYLMPNGHPYQKYVDAGYMRLADRENKTAYGPEVYQVTVFKGKGQIWIIEKLRELYKKKDNQLSLFE